MKSIKLILLFFMAFACQSFAQNEGELTELLKENRELSKEVKQKDSEISTLQKDIETLKKEIEKLTQKVDKAEADLKAERESSKSAAFKKQMDDLKKENDELKAKLEDQKKASEEAKAAVKSESSALIAKLQEDIRNSNQKNEELAKDLDDLNGFKKDYLKQLADQVDEKWLTKSYSQIELDALKKDYARYEEFAASDAKVKEAYDKLTKLVHECEIYKRGVVCVNNPYNGVFVASALQGVKSLAGTISGLKATEMGILETQLKDYKVTVEIFKEDVIPAVDKIIEDMPDHKSALSMIKPTLEKIETEDGYITSIKAIPWLKVQYDEYLKQLERNCKAPNKARKAVMDITL